ncbi:MAG: zinc-ribbon domain-containing protein, partial [Ruminococcus sp.]|nr:zinc-ribbon domain-containing protein [Ruminococcus sp.]
MYCENCGHPLRDGDLFCTKCGAPIERKNIGGRNVNMNTGEHGSAPAPAEKPKSRRKGLIVALSVAGGVCVLGLLVWLMLSCFLF